MKVRLSITAVAAVLALVGSSAALAGSSPDDRALPVGTSWNQVKQATGTPDDRALARGTSWTIKSKTVIATPDDRSFARSFPSVERPTVVRVSSGGFDWTDASVGAASGFGIALVLLGAALIYSRRGTGRPVAA